MLNIEVRFSLPIVYHNAFVTLHACEHNVVFHLKEGTHVAQSPLLDLGVAHSVEGRPLLGHFSFEYTYEPARRLITVCGTDFDSARGMCLTTVPEGTSEQCRQRGAGGGFEADELRANPRWNYLTPLTPGLRDVFEGVVRTVNDRLVEALKKVPQLNVQVRQHPPELSAEEHRKFLTVYRDGQFLGLHEPGREYGPLDEVYSVESVFGGEVFLNYGEAFANVIGSTNDPKIAGLTWIQLWANQFNTYPVICTSYQFNGFGCGNSLLGGHVIGGTQATVVPQGSNSVWILPICIQHNNTNAGYMEALKYLTGIWLKNYLG